MLCWERLLFSVWYPVLCCRCCGVSLPDCIMRTQTRADWRICTQYQIKPYLPSLTTQHLLVTASNKRVVRLVVGFTIKWYHLSSSRCWLRIVKTANILYPQSQLVTWPHIFYADNKCPAPSPSPTSALGWLHHISPLSMTFLSLWRQLSTCLR